MNAAPAYGVGLAYAHHHGFAGLSRGAAPDAVDAMPETAGFRVASGLSYGTCELPPGRRAFIGRKPA